MTEQRNFQITLEKQNFTNAAAAKRRQIEDQIKAGQEFNLSYGIKAVKIILDEVEDYIKTLYTKKNQHTKKFYWDIIKPLHEKGEKPELRISEVVAVNLVGSLSKQTGYTQAAGKMARNTLITLNVPFEQRDEYKDSALQFFATIIQHVAETTDIYTVDQINGRENFLFVSDEWKEVIEEAQEKYALNADNYAPMTSIPDRHINLFSGKGGFYFLDSPLLKDLPKIKGRVPKELKEFTASNNAEFFEIINARQEVPYCVNVKLLNVLKNYYSNGLTFSKFPVVIDQEAIELETKGEIDSRNKKRREYADFVAQVKADVEAGLREAPKPRKVKGKLVEFDLNHEYSPLLLSTMNEIRRKFTNQQVEAVRKTNALFEQADFYSEQDKFYFNVFLDHRFRCYPYASSGLTYQGDKMAKPLVELANKEVLTEDGLTALMETLGNALGFDKLSVEKKCEAAMKWWKENVRTFELGDFSMFFFEEKEFDEPITALAIVLELLGYTKDPLNYKCGFIAHRDARVSGSSIIGTILRDKDVMEMTSVLDWVSEDGKLKDGYTSVADTAKAITQKMADEGNTLAIEILNHEAKLFDRDTFKKLVMTRVSYGLTDYSAREHTASRIKWDDVLSGEHKKLFDTIVFKTLDEAMPSCSGYLKCAKEVGKEVVGRDGHLKFISPVNGAPIFFHALKTDKRTIEVNTGFSRIQLNIMTNTNKTDNQAMIREIAPGIIHHLDSSLLYLVDKFTPGMDKAMIHDSIGTHPNNVKTVINAYAKAMFVMSQSDVFDKIFEQLDTQIRVAKTETVSKEECRAIMDSHHILA